MVYRLSTEVYTRDAVANGVAAFAHLCTAQMCDEIDYTLLTLDGGEQWLHAELLNYILGLSAKDLLQ
ncbi:hypothetical protein [Paludibaculum fermentans]|uniref:hypothetical protein n=1 Tax=Paludibaculum fermentans TaxID=1473598 RepID=UPI003EBEEC63